MENLFLDKFGTYILFTAFCKQLKFEMYTAFDTIWPSDSVEFCPANPRNIFVCGTYKLDPSSYTAKSSSDETEYVESTEPGTQLRRGKCMVFEVTSNLRRVL